MSAAEEPYDPYALSPADIQEPPESLWAALRKIGPGIVLAGSIVGSGELILTTALGAEFGFQFLWLILYSCVIKVFVQIELGRYAISSGLPTLAAFNSLPGWRWRTHWIVWWWFIMLLTTITQMGGMITGVAQSLQLAWPLDSFYISMFPVSTEGAAKVSKIVYSSGVALAIIALLLSGGYRQIERLTTVLVVGVTAFTVIGVAALQATPYAIHLEVVAMGLLLTIPAGGVAKAFGCFGITGVGASELFTYPYWCVEKGYARWTGPRTDDEAWVRRAQGWMRVLYLDAWVSMLVFTAATLAFYALGAGVLNPQHLVPEDSKMVRVLSELYVPSFGAWTRTAFLVGVFAVLFKTLYVGVAGHSRLTTDFFGLAGFISTDAESRRFWIKLLCVFYPILALSIPVTLMVLYNIESPRTLVQFGAMVQAATLPVISGATLYLRYRRLDPRLAPPLWSDIVLWFAAISITAVALYATGEKAVSTVESLRAPPKAAAPK